MSSQDMQSLVNRLSNTKSARVPDSQRMHSKEDKYVRGVVPSHAYNGHIKHCQLFTRTFRKVRL